MRNATIRRALALAILSGAALALPAPASADGVPQTITHQGRLYDATEKPINATLAVKFAIYADTMTTTALWSETDMVTFDDGYFSVSIGQTTPFPAGLFNGAVLYMGITVGTDPEMTPRPPIQSVPYAMVAGDAIGDINPTSVSIGGTTVIDATGKWVGPATGLQGPQGMAGPTGPQGAAGPAGTTGPAGPAGPTGPQGAQGAAGPAGAQGAPGPAGAQGVAGTAGAQGAQGVPGPAGATGAQGAVGATGAQGPAGAQGANGANGAVGPTGSAGPAGANGANGAVGPTGSAGPAGANGANGAVGPTGPAGANGAQGPQGAVGPTGASGFSATYNMCGGGNVTRTNGSQAFPCLVTATTLNTLNTYLCDMPVPSAATVTSVYAYGYKFNTGSSGYIEASAYGFGNTTFSPTCWATPGCTWQNSLAQADGNITLTLDSSSVAMNAGTRYVLAFATYSTSVNMGVYFYGFQVNYTLSGVTTTLNIAANACVLQQ